MIWLVVVVVLVTAFPLPPVLVRSERVLLAPGDAYNAPVTGAFVNLGVGPVAATHVTQIPQTNWFLVVDFLNGDPHPESNADGTKILWLYDVDSNTYIDVPVPSNIVCGGWTRIGDGDVVMFGGNAPYEWLPNGVKDLYVYNLHTGELEDKGAMLEPRWYATGITLPDGKAYVAGGTTLAGAYSKTPGAEIYDPATGEQEYLPVNPELLEAGLGNFYMGIWVLPTGDLVIFNSNMVQVMEVYTGEVKARGPPLPEILENLRWEYPYTGTQILLNIPPARLGKPTNTWEFVMFGGNWEGAGELTVCSHYSLRISLEIKTIGAYEFGPWVVEEMPGPRCHMDSVLLPNGKVLLVNGAEMGLGGLPDAPAYACGNCCNEPVTEPWEYDPQAPPGQRYTRTGAFSTIPRMYHSVGQLTRDGDVLLGGCTNCGASMQAFKYPRDLYDLTTFGNSEYRLEVYRPRYVFSPFRPTITFVPQVLTYGVNHTVGFALVEGSTAISKVVLQDTGTTTHGYTMNRRQLELRFTAGLNSLQVEAPLTSNWAPPGWYVLFLLVGDVYSTGRWVRLSEDARKGGSGTVVLPPEDRYGAPWSCMSFQAPWAEEYNHLAVRHARVGQDVQCLSSGVNTGCLMFTSLEQCTSSVIGKENDPSVTCGNQHQLLWGASGYSDPDHWCTLALALLGPSPSASQVDDGLSGWTCIHLLLDWLPAGQGYYALRLSAAGEVECLSFEAQACVLYATSTTCRQLVRETDPSEIQPLACGDMHASLYSNTGYDVEEHWCQVGRRVFS